jgi:hypothetical protein
MEINIVSLLILFFRLAPFILVCFFVIASIFNQDLKGLVYLVGLIFAIFLNLMIENSGWVNSIGILNRDEAKCSNITFHFANATILPFSQTVLGYTFAYLLWVIVSMKIVEQNIVTIIFFSLLMFSDIIWNAYNGCFSMAASIISIIIGGGMGTLWGFVIDQSHNTELQYFVGYSNNEICSKPSKSTFRCKVYKNGQLIQS